MKINELSKANGNGVDGEGSILPKPIPIPIQEFDATCVKD